MDPGTPQDFVGEEVAESGYDRLVDQGGLDLSALAGQLFPQLSFGHLQRVWSGIGEDPADIVLVVGQPKTCSLRMSR